MATSKYQVLIIAANYNDLVCQYLALSNHTSTLKHRQNSYHIQLCQSHLEAIEACLIKKPDCILLDWELTNLDGSTFLQQMSLRQIPVVLLISTLMEELISNMQWDYYDYLIKEVLNKELIFSAIRNAISQSQLHQEVISTNKKLQKFVFNNSFTEIQTKQNQTQQDFFEQDIKTEFSKYNLSESLLEIQNRCLGCIAMGDPLAETFNLLSLLIDLQTNDALCSILVIDHQDKLKCIAEPNLPNDFSLVLNDIPLDEITPVFGNTLEGRSVNISDITNSHLQDYKNLAISHGFKALWINPILSRNQQKVLGFCILCYRELLQPSIEELKVIRNSIYAASIAIERNHSDVNLQQQLQREKLLYQQLQQELSDRQKVEVELRESQKFIQQIADASPNILYLYNVQERRNIYANREIYCILGYTTQDVQDMGADLFQRLIHPDDIGQVSINLARLHAAEDGTIIDMDYRMQHANGEWRWLHSRDAVFSRDEHGNILLVIGSAQDITDRKRYEKALQTSEAHQRALISALPDLLMRINREGIYLEFLASPNFHVLGSSTDLVGTSISQVLSHELAQERIEYICKALDTNSIQVYEQILLIDGKTQVEEVRIVPYAKDEVLLLVRDISEKKRAEEALRISERRFERIAATLPGMIYTMIRRVDGSHYFEYISSGVEKISEVTVEQILEDPKWLDDQHHPDDRAGFAADANHSVATMTPFNHEWRIITPSGKIKWLQLRSLPEKIEEIDVALLNRQRGDIARHGIMLEITDRKIAEEALRESERRFERIAETLPGIIYTTIQRPDGSKYFEYVSSGIERIYEITVEEALNNPQFIYDCIHPEDQTSLFKALNRSAKNLLPFSNEWRIITPSGKIKWLQISAFVEKTHGMDINLFKRQNGDIVRHGLVLEITDRKLAELQVRQQTEQQKLIGSITQRIRASLNLKEILNTTVAEIHQVLNSSRVLVYQVFADGTGTAIAESVSFSCQPILNNTYSEEVFPIEIQEQYLKGKVYALSDLEIEPVLPCLVEFLKEIKVRAKLVVPIIQDEKLWGLLIAHQCDHPRHWQDWEIDLMQQLSSQFAIAIQQASLYQQLQLELHDRQYAENLIRQQADREALLREIMQRIRQSLDLHTIFETATLEIRQFLQADRVGIFKFEPDSGFNDGEFVAESVVAGFYSVVKVPCHDHCFGERYSQSYKYGDYQAVGDIYNAGLSQCHIDVLEAFQIRANLVVPLLNGSSLWGLICIHQCSSPRNWETEEIILIQQISNQLAIAIQQANLYQQVQEELANKETLYIQLANELHQKKVLLKEVHHRVKNNLQVMSSLLRMQFRKTTPDLKILIEDYQNRIQSMALIHAQLHRNDDLASIDFHDYISDLLSNLFQCYGNASANIQSQVDVTNIFLPIEQSIPLGLIINELISNTLKYAFPHGSGEINIQLMQTANKYHLTVADNGIGIPQEIDLENTDSLGMQLVYSLTEQLEGHLIYSSENGTKFQVIFPVL
ncbi:MAG: GAF domain-containing protein [Pseudanabaena sp.]|jgi:PAS domain S-box-containing protein